MAKAKPKSNAAAFRSLEAELAGLYGYEHQTPEAAAKAEAQIAKAEARIKAICDLAKSDDPGFDDFIYRLRSKWRSSQHFIDYCQERNRLLLRLGEVSADKHRRTLEESKQLRAVFIANRDRRMAEEFLRKKKLSTGVSETKLKVDIGERYGRKRTASIEAINRELEALGLKSAKPRKA